MDVVGAVLDGHRARGAFVLRCAMTAPWSVRIADRAAVTLLVVQAGTVWLTPAAGPPHRLRPGDTAVIKEPTPYLLGDDPSTAPMVSVDPGQVCRPLTAAAGAFAGSSERWWGNDADGPDRFVVGVYELPGQVSGQVLRDLPDLMIVPADEAGRAVVDLLVAEVERDAPGQDLVLDRLVDLVLVDTLRAWLTAAGPDAPAWWRAGADAVTGTALRAMHDHPDLPWTLAALAAEAGVSRATLARRFAQDVGTSPLAYLTEWRLAQAADLLRTTTDTVERVAHRVGYANAFAFSTAFKRRYGWSPRDHRRSAQPASADRQLGGA